MSVIRKRTSRQLTCLISLWFRPSINFLTIVLVVIRKSFDLSSKGNHNYKSSIKWIIFFPVFCLTALLLTSPTFALSLEDRAFNQPIMKPLYKHSAYPCRYIAARKREYHTLQTAYLRKIAKARLNAVPDIIKDDCKRFGYAIRPSKKRPKKGLIVYPYKLLYLLSPVKQIYEYDKDDILLLNRTGFLSELAVPTLKYNAERCSILPWPVFDRRRPHLYSVTRASQLQTKLSLKTPPTISELTTALIKVTQMSPSPDNVSQIVDILDKISGNAVRFARSDDDPSLREKFLGEALLQFDRDDGFHERRWIGHPGSIAKPEDYCMKTFGVESGLYEIIYKPPSYKNKKHTAPNKKFQGGYAFRKVIDIQ